MPVVRSLLCLIVLLALPSSATAQATRLQTFEFSELEIVTDTDRHSFTVEMAITPAQQSQGLMFRRNMAPDAGMLFVHRRESVRSMWMRNTFIPLDMLFIKADGRIARIAERTIPQSLKTISSGEPVSAVLELNAGTVRRLGIAVGDSVVHPDIGAGG